MRALASHDPISCLLWVQSSKSYEKGAHFSSGTTSSKPYLFYISTVPMDHIMMLITTSIIQTSLLFMNTPGLTIKWCFVQGL